MATYEFMGCKIRNQGYHQPDHCVWWEATDGDGNVVAHGKSLRECEFIILENKVKRETEDRIKKETAGNAAAMRETLRLCREEFCDTCENSKPCKLKCVHVGIIDRALAAPARNCDRFEDAPSAYADFVVPWKLDGHLDDIPTLQDFANWLFAPATEKGADDGK